MTPIIEERKQLRERGEESPVSCLSTIEKPPNLNFNEQMDALTWLMDEAEGSELNHENLAIRVLLIDFGALSTTTLVSIEKSF